MLCSMSLISPNFDVKSIIFPNFGQGPFPKIAGKSPDVTKMWMARIKRQLCNTVIVILFV